MLSTATGNRTHPQSVRGADLYETPAVAVQALLRVEPVPMTVWEPACGPGAIVRELEASGRAVISSDLIDYGWGHEAGIDFLMETKAPPGVPGLVTNPPFKNCEAFVSKALDLVPEVYMLLRLAFLEGIRWHDADKVVSAHASRARDLRKGLARVHVFAPRLPMMHRDGWEGPKNSNSGMAFAWFVWIRGHRYAPTIDWIYTNGIDTETAS